MEAKITQSHAPSAKQGILSADRDATVHSTAVPTIPGVTIPGISIVSSRGEEKPNISESRGSDSLFHCCLQISLEISPSIFIPDSDNRCILNEAQLSCVIPFHIFE